MLEMKKVVELMRFRDRRWIPIAAVLTAAAVILFLVVRYIDRASPVSISGIQMIDTIVIDPGHGGVDGGATGIGGVVEKDINLQIGLKLRDIFQMNGYQVVMTRDTDKSIHSSGKNLSQQKKSDMQNRLKIIENTPNSITISIHQNLYEESKYSGAQMFYGRVNEESKLLASAIQKRFVANLQKDNKREIKEAQKNLYLMYYAKTPIVLVECGFLSNPVESALLSDDTYQNKVAFTIFCGIMDYFGQV